MKYIGKGFITGVPTRDLTDEEVIKYGKKKLLDSGLYAEESKKKSRRETIKQAAQSAAEDN